MGEPVSKKKGLIAAVASILLVAAIVAAVVTTRGSGEESPDVESTTRSVDAVCAPTQYPETCRSSLAGANTSDPKKLIETAIDVAVDKVGHALNQSSLLREAATDPMTKQAYDVCREVLEKAVDDLRRSVDEIGAIDGAKVSEYMNNLRTWLSAVITNQETCVDAFENTTGDTGEKMKKLLKTARELSSNGLAMVTDMSQFIETFQLGDLLSGRKLMAEDESFVERRLQQAAALSVKPTIVVAKDGSGKFKRISDAVASLPKTTNTNNTFTVIQIKGGVYDENVDIPKGLNKVVLIGDGPTATKIIGKKSVGLGVQTYYTATLAVNGDDFVAKDLGVENTAGPKGFQALAVRISGDRSVLYNVQMDGYQDTLCADLYRQYYKSCTISGSIDFVFGNSLALFQDCTFVTRKPDPGQECAVAAHGRSDPNSNTAIVIQNGKFTAEPALLSAKPPVPSYLGRPWKVQAKTIIMQSQIEAFINESGWAKMIADNGIDTCFYAEYGNRGPGADTARRVKWKGIRQLTGDQVQQYTGGVLFGASGDAWIKDSGAPYVPTMMKL